MKAPSLGQKTRHASSTLYLVPPRADRLSEGRRLATLVVGETERDHALARRGAHPDVIELLPADGKERVGIAAVREAVRAGQFAPVQGDRKVCLIPLAEALTVEAANALLKTLEEPPREMAFVLLASHTADLLPTIVSRSRIVRLSNEEPADLIARLSKLGYSEEDAQWLIEVADREGEIDRFLEAHTDVAPLRDETSRRARSLSATDLMAACTDGESLVRRAALERLLELALERDPNVLTSGIRTLASQSREVLFAFLHDLLDVSFERVRSDDTAAARRACRAIETAYRALSVYTSAEALLLSLFLTIGGVIDGE